MVTLFATPLSANGRKALAVVRHLQIPAHVEIVDVYRGEGRAIAYLRINPLGKIPTLTDGDFVLTESNAIIQYLAEAHGDFRLTSRDPRRRADIARWLFWESSQWQPSLIPVLSACVGHLLLPDTVPAPAASVRWDDPALRAQLGFLDDHLGPRTFLTGAELTLADLAVAGMMTYAHATGFPFARHPGIARWYARIEALDAWRATAAGPWA